MWNGGVAKAAWRPGGVAEVTEGLAGGQGGIAAASAKEEADVEKAGRDGAARSGCDFGWVGVLRAGGLLLVSGKTDAWTSPRTGTRQLWMENCVRMPRSGLFWRCPKTANKG